ncbi:MAG: type III-A CRISPR-associated protein Csm2 [Ignavibacteriaceae bacterium]|nr:type III-A CRISPR-associated protein Csm2 [Ignavibacteriaceae bacterium]
MTEGKITRIPPGKEFFFIDNDYWCHKTSINFEPQEGDVVAYDKEKQPDGKFRAKRVKLISKGESTISTVSTGGTSVSAFSSSQLREYLDELEQGYFNDAGYLKEDFSIKYPIFLAKLFNTNTDVNKSSQIRGFFDHCIMISGKFKYNRQFEYVKHELSQLDSKITYALNRKNISQEFCDFFKANLELAKKSDINFKNGFLPHLQALIAYYIKN